MFSKENFLWNSGIFFGKADFIISSIDEFSPDVSKSCNLALKYMIEEDDKTFNFCNESFKAIPKISIDYAVLEKDKRIKCFELDIGWEDVGSFESFFRVLKDKSNKENSIDIKKKSVHFIQNREETDLEIIEIQIGSYFSEDDIIRVDDPYKR